jgi:hypothetical protein
MTLIVCVPKNGNNNFRVGTSVIFIFFVLKDTFIWLSDKQLLTSLKSTVKSLVSTITGSMNDNINTCKYNNRVNE